MTIQNLVDTVESIVLDTVGIKTFYIGDVWDESVTKGDEYPVFWFETPILVDYNTSGRHFKTFQFSVNIIKLPKFDDTADELSKISEAEVLMDKFLQYLFQNKTYSIFGNPSVLSMKSVNADKACGVRADVTVNVKRECLPS